ncbi:DUF6765 family protein [Clostridioides difficile]|uniref:DUF6765 family protein n=1 Tax=Clostridioides difficile TaxID=1496 RepID=UPI001C1986BA|nr:DUF6765 family protein [Clostridioides difficile]MDF3814828.1 hypothetical protein [Clostridioides difficile]MDK3178300.1 hypothetical protein [Clostridioides difficile]HBF0841521.1 hypothetical protein [Clostridioides difficile]HBF4283181.1 hypothetical protein [Clostridioides difficile]HBF5046917.1 hypothetical protein [Clostridioides difficile]
MNLDFHYYGTYLAAKIAGYNDLDANTIAYAAQYVDESTKSMILDDVNFTLPTVQTNSELIGYYADFTSWGYKWNLDSLNEIKKVWIPFHFLPGNLNNQFEYKGVKESKGLTINWKFKDGDNQKFRLMCLPNSETVSAIINDLIYFHNTEEYKLQFIGMRMHVLADTWAHMYFIGKPEWYINDVKEFIAEESKYIEETKWTKAEEYRNKSWHSINFIGVPGFGGYEGTSYHGHGRMGHIPDYGYLNYRYIPNWSSTDDKVKIEKNNQDDFFKAFCQMVYALKCIKNGNDFSINKYDNLTENQKTEVKKVIATRKDDQSEAWKKAINALGYNSLENFDKNKWKNEFIKSTNKEKTDYYYFNLVAKKHVDYVTDFLEEKRLSLEEMSSEYCKFKNFDDTQFAKNRNRVTKIILRGAYIVDAIQIVYDEKYKTPMHGEPLGGTVVSLDLDVDDYIVKISGSIGLYEGGEPYPNSPTITIGKITFLTKKGKTITAGHETMFKSHKNFTLEAPTGKQIFALKGSYLIRKLRAETNKRYLDCLGIASIKDCSVVTSTK